VAKRARRGSTIKDEREFSRLYRYLVVRASNDLVLARLKKLKSSQ